jgi:hypothetical protein
VLAATLIIKTARLLHAGRAVVSRVKRRHHWKKKNSTSAALSDPRSSSGMSALGSAARVTVIASSSPKNTGRGSAVPLSQRSPVRPGHRADGEGPRATGKIRLAARTPENLAVATA